MHRGGLRQTGAVLLAAARLQLLLEGEDLVELLLVLFNQLGSVSILNHQHQVGLLLLEQL